MTVEQAAALLQTPRIDWERPQAWYDLGCGDGVFTKALATLLPRGSVIHAVDVDLRALQEVPEEYNGVMIRKVAGDLASPSLRIPAVDGVLMANSLHFIRDQAQLLARLHTPNILVVEYERSRAGRWSPYPVEFAKLCALFHGLGIKHVEQVATRKSRFGGTMYSALAATCHN